MEVTARLIAGLPRTIRGSNEITEAMDPCCADHHGGDAGLEETHLTA